MQFQKRVPDFKNDMTVILKIVYRWYEFYQRLRNGLKQTSPATPTGSYNFLQQGGSNCAGRNVIVLSSLDWIRQCSPRVYTYHLLCLQSTQTIQTQPAFWHGQMTLIVYKRQWPVSQKQNKQRINHSFLIAQCSIALN